MASTRIRYGFPRMKHADQNEQLAAEGWQHSRRDFEDPNGHLWRIAINESQFKFKVYNLNTQDSIEYSKTKNLNVLKRKIRETLEKLGIELNTEVRKKQNESGTSEETTGSTIS